MTGGRRCVLLMARLLLGGVFLWAGVLKAVDPLAFARSLATYQLLPQQGNLLVAVTLPWVEIVCATLLLLGWRVRPAALVAAVLNLIFIVAIASVLARGLNVDCGCFGHDAATPPELALLRDLVLLALALWLLHRPSTEMPPG